MNRFQLRSLAAAQLALTAVLVFNVSARPQSGGSEPPKDQKGVPVGAEKAVKAALAASPGAVLEDVVTPSRSIGIGGPDIALWTIHTRSGDSKQTLTVSGNGVLIRGSKVIESKDLPTLVANGMAKVGPNGATRISKLETLGIVRYVALPTPEVRYSARVSNDDETLTVTLSPDGKVLDTKKAKPVPTADPKARTEDGPIPEQAAKAVQAVREVFPKMIFDLVEEVPYIDSSTQTIVMLWYEVEFFLDGVQHQVDATPDGLVIAYTKAIPASGLPKAAADALVKAMPKGKVEAASKSETRAELRFVPLENPVTVYEIQPRGVEGASPAAIKLRTDGTEVKELDLPNWAKDSSKKEGKEGK